MMGQYSAARARKLQRLRAGGKPRLLELCSGCGGMSLGFAAAGFSLVAHAEVDPTASESYAANFTPTSGTDFNAWKQPIDITAAEAADLIQAIGLSEPTHEVIDVVAAGLPCQAFARIGRSKLRSINGEENAYRNDGRAQLYRHFLEHVAATQPVAIVIENVPDILNFGGHNVPEEICSTLEEWGYITGYTLMNAAFYGVPQMRERLFLIALDGSLGIRPHFPKATHSANLPAGYEGTRTFAMHHVPEGTPRFIPVGRPAGGLRPAVSVRAALADLPYISEHYRKPGEMRHRRVADELEYRIHSGIGDYARLMREWPGLRTGGTVTGNVVRITPRDFPIFARMQSGSDYPRALAVALALFEERLDEERIRPEAGSERWLDLKRQCVPPYDPGKFPNKWWKLDPALPSRTLTAHMGRDTYSHIHWDSRQRRTISVREAARLQSFPDGFRFVGEMNAAFRQIGNAVPPLLARAVATQLRKDLRSEPRAVAGERIDLAA